MKCGQEIIAEDKEIQPTASGRMIFGVLDVVGSDRRVQSYVRDCSELLCQVFNTKINNQIQIIAAGPLLTVNRRGHCEEQDKILTTTEGHCIPTHQVTPSLA